MSEKVGRIAFDMSNGQVYYTKKMDWQALCNMHSKAIMGWHKESLLGIETDTEKMSLSKNNICAFWIVEG